jgi:hypothetical protein
MTSKRINLVTAVSRPGNLPRIHRSIIGSLARTKMKAKWILVADEALSPSIEDDFRRENLEVQAMVYAGGPCAYGIAQKNLGMSKIANGFFHCLDDDNLVHPLFFTGLEWAVNTHPSKRAFVVGQQRWDSLNHLVASPDRMEYGQIDNTMFVVHSSLIGQDRYDLKHSGREDFEFFRKLWDFHKDEFIFIGETLSYYNYLRHFPGESWHEPIRQFSASDIPAPPPASDPVFVAQAAPPAPIFIPPPVLEPAMKIALYSSKRDRCGISTYTSHLMDALIRLGHSVKYFGSQKPYEPAFSEALAWKPDVFHFQHESSIMPPEDDLARYAEFLRNGGSKVMITLHTEMPETIRIGRRVGRIIMHRPAPDAKDAVIIPMPCTNADAMPDKNVLRRKFGIPENAFVLSTVGFMIPWKDHPKLVEMLLPWIQEHPDRYLQVIASEHFNEDLRGYADSCRKQIRAFAGRFDGRIIHVDGYPSDLELVERLAASDLGYVWCPFDTGSSSAAAAQFTTAQCPLVATDSSHYACLGTGIVRSPKNSMAAFVDTIRMTSADPELLGRLKANQVEMYNARNYTETARKHLAIYKGEI